MNESQSIVKKPILFNTEMVKAILENRKTCTRRIIKKKYENADIEWFENKYGKRLVYIQNDAPAPRRNPNGTTTHSLIAMEEIKKPYQIGDILYVRETWAIQSMSNSDKRIKFMYKVLGDKDLEIRYVSSSRYEELLKYSYKNGWQPSLFMPKEAARIFLKITNIRAERLQDITEEQAKLEGAYMPCYKCGTRELTSDSVTLFKVIWESTLKKDHLEMYNWKSNPWVWAIEFEVIQNM